MFAVKLSVITEYKNAFLFRSCGHVACAETVSQSLEMCFHICFNTGQSNDKPGSK